MIFGGREDGGGVLELTAAEMTAFKAGKAIVRFSGDAYGMFCIEAKITRPCRRAKRFPVEVYGSDYSPPKAKYHE